MKPVISEHGIKLKDLCARLAVNYNEARYTLARGVLPKAIAEVEPGRGNHRQFNHAQAFYLAVVLKLKSAGITTTLAAEISEWSRRVQHLAVNAGWDWRFAPFAGNLTTKKQWYVEVGDARYVRLVTDANPSVKGLFAVPWVDMVSRKECISARPAVMIRVDIALIAQQLISPEAGDASAGR